MTTTNKKSYLGYLNKLKDEYKNSYYHSMGKKTFDTRYFDLTQKIEYIHKVSKFQKYSTKVTLKIGQKKYL